jgi:glutathione S-transferase
VVVSERRQFAGVDWPWFDNLPLPRLKARLANYLASEIFDRIMYRVSPWSSGAKATIVEEMTVADS